MNRRDSLQKLMLGGTVLFLAPSVLQSCSKKDDLDPGITPGNSIEIDLTKAENSVLNNAGGAKVVQSILVINTGTNFIALSSICTHEGCTVGYNHEANKIKCPCHFSEFSTSGALIMGPATRPLESFGVSKTGNILKISV